MPCRHLAFAGRRRHPDGPARAGAGGSSVPAPARTTQARLAQHPHGRVRRSAAEARRGAAQRAARLSPCADQGQAAPQRSHPQHRPRQRTTGLGYSQPAVELGQQAAVVLGHDPGRAIDLQALADMPDRAGRLLVRVGRAAEHVGQEPRAQEGLRHDLLDDGERARAAQREQRPVPGEIGRALALLPQKVLDGDLPVAGDVGRERAAIGRQRAELGRSGGRAHAEEQEARLACRGKRQQAEVGRRIRRRHRRRRAHELAGEIVGPAMEAATKALAIA